ncbi:thylakoid membrane protein slr0575 [Dioscorea cayenensis subsp. rotundata]|uniref:Thylakoid membrane protein slr0575 n=1 Tax=Dioscorea cayennensis subsp. rotundata TaxID=55577 RepID=A0AB40B1Z0_DIOCR|nr:thylakoid membrane protein slr0575 [Dioscorea cayenensis subsp. rotundata]
MSIRAAAPLPLCASRSTGHAPLCPSRHHGLALWRGRFGSSTGGSHSPLSLLPLRCLVTLNQRRSRLVVVVDAVDSTQPSTSSDKTVVTDSDFSLAKVSFGTIGLTLGCTLLSYGFGAYFNILPGSEWSAIMLTYGFPIAIIGMALKYAELKPVPCVTYSDAQILREKCATPILKQVRDDVIRFRYGDEQHLDEALKRIFQYGQGGGISRRNAPILQMVREEVTANGKYCLVLVFEAKALQLSDFEQRKAKFTSFFGPGISTDISGGENNLYEVRLISETT